jgi:cell division protein FtsL
MYQSKLSDLHSKDSIVSKVPRRSRKAAAMPPKAVELGRTRQTQQVRELHRHVAVPPWLKSLLNIQKGAKVIFAVVVGTIPIVYGYTVYTQDQWKNQHGQLNRLRAREQQQVVMNENLKYQMAETAEHSNSGLVSPTPDRMVFIAPAPARPFKQRPQTPVANPNPELPTPQGY